MNERTRQTGFDFSELKKQLGPSYEEFISKWSELQTLLSSRGRAVIQAGRILCGLVESFGVQYVRQAVQLSKAPGWQRAQALMQAFEWLRDKPLTDREAAVLDSIVYKRLPRNLRQQALEWMKNDRAVEEIEDLLDSIGPISPTRPAPPTITEPEVRSAYAETLRRDGWDVRMEQRTKDGGAVDIYARKDGKQLIAECKVDLNRSSVIEALGQLTVYSQSFPQSEWRVVYWRQDDSALPVESVCNDLCAFHKVALTTAAEAAS